MSVLMCVVRIRCFPGKSDHHVYAQICGCTKSATLRTLYLLPDKQCAGYELCCPSTRGLAPSRHWKLRTKQYDLVHLLFPSLSCQLTPLRIAKYSERVNSVSWRFPSYGIWHVGAAGPRFIVAWKDVFACVTLRQADCQMWFLVNFSTEVFFRRFMKNICRTIFTKTGVSYG